MIRQIFKKDNYVLLGTLLSAIILLITYSLCGFFGFGGDNSILRVDLYHQYAPFHEELRQKLLNGESLFYSWEGGLGKEFLSQIAYYTASPISLLILFFKTEYISEAILLFVFIKIVLCSFCFGYYLKNTFKRNDVFVAIFCVMYAFMAYITSFYWNIMWLDSIYLFPIVALGINRLIQEGKFKTYLFSLMLCIIVNFYIAFLVCIFATLYFLVKLFSDYSLKDDGKIILDRIIKFGILSLLAGGFTMFLAIPTAVALGRTQTSDANFPSFEMYKNVYQLITSHFSGAKPVVLARNEDLPNVYSGVLTMTLLPMYFFNNKIKIKEKVLFGVFILFMLACSVFKQLDFIIHGMHFPANLPHRYTFIYSFVILTLSFKAIVNIEGIKPKIFFIMIPFYAIYMLISEYLIVPKIDSISQTLTMPNIIANVILLTFYALIITKYKKYITNQDTKTGDFKKLSNMTFVMFLAPILAIFLGGVVYNNKQTEDIPFPFLTIALFIIFVVFSIMLLKFIVQNSKQSYNITAITIILIFVVCSEAVFNCANGFMHSGTTSRSDYIKYVDGTEQILKYIKDTDNDENKFFRQEFSRFTAINESTMYHYNGFSQFSSLAYGDLSKLIENLGIAATGNSYRYYDPTPLIDSMFNIKYIMGKDNKIVNRNYDYIDQFDNIYLYKNKTPLSLGFMVDENILNWENLDNFRTPFDVQNSFVQNALNTDEKLLTEFKIEHFRADNVDIKEKDSKQEYSYTLHDAKNLDLKPTVYARGYMPKRSRAFLYVEAPNAKRFKYCVNNGQVVDREISTGRSLIDLGILNEGDFVDIEFTLDRKGSYDTSYHKSGNFRVYGATFDNELFGDCYLQLEDEMLIVNDYDSTKLTGTITAKNDGIMYTSIPYDDGFKVYVDGKESDILSLGDGGLIGVRLSKGVHNIEFKYSVKGFKVGLIITMFSIIGIVLYFIIDKKRNKNHSLL